MCLSTGHGQETSWLGQYWDHLCRRLVEPGDVVVGDDDGGRRRPPPRGGRCRRSGIQVRETKEAENQKRYMRGELSLDVNNMRADLVRAGGLRYVDYKDAVR